MSEANSGATIRLKIHNARFDVCKIHQSDIKISDTCSPMCIEEIYVQHLANASISGRIRQGNVGAHHGDYISDAEALCN